MSILGLDTVRFRRVLFLWTGAGHARWEIVQWCALIHCISLYYRAMHYCFILHSTALCIIECCTALCYTSLYIMWYRALHYCFSIILYLTYTTMLFFTEQCTILTSSCIVLNCTLYYTNFNKLCFTTVIKQA